MLKYLLLFTVLLVGCGPQKQRLNVLYYPDSFDPNIIAEFERQFDCKVVLDYFVAGASTEVKLAAGGVSTYDVVGTGMDGFAAVSESGLAAPLRHENIPNLKNIEARFLNLEFDPGNRFTVPYLWGMIGLCVRVQNGVKIEPSWAWIFNPTNQPGPFVLMDEPRTCIGAALRYLGYSVNTVKPEELAAARDVLVQTKQRALGFEQSLGISHRVLSGSVNAAISWNETAIAETRNEGDIRFFIPREGSSLAMDSFFITAKAPHRDLAEKFLNFLLDAKVAAANANLLKLATPNKAAYELLTPEMRNNPVIYPPKETLQRLEFLKDVKEKQKLYDEIWTQIKSK